MRRVAFFLCAFILLSATFAMAAPSGESMLRPYLKSHGMPAMPTKDPIPVVGDTHTFSVWDMTVMPPADATVDATCRGVSANGYVFIDDTQWNDTVTQADVDAILSAWDVQTPAGSLDPAKGIYEIETGLYGMPPDIDGWPGVVFLYYAMGCYVDPQGNTYCFDGFYRNLDETNDPGSNHMDMLHLDTTQNPPGGDYMLGIIAHEFNHMLQGGHDADETIWLSESLAEAAMIETGYVTDLAWLNDFVAHPDTTFWDDGQSVNYGAAMLMGTYLYQRGGADLLTAITADPNNGTGSVEYQLIQLGISTSFAEFFGDMAAAIASDYFVDHGSADYDGRFQYDLLNVGELSWDQHIDNTAGMTWGATPVGGGFKTLFIDMTGDAKSLHLEFDDASAGLEAAVIGISPSSLSVTRTDSSASDWPSPTFDLGDAQQAVVVVANADVQNVAASIQVSFGQPSADDDTAGSDDTQADDTQTDDAAGDDDSSSSSKACGC